ncbi:MAG: LamG-like jellyroll fold domain-containing protein [Verrucomicrobiota bacterium]
MSPSEELEVSQLCEALLDDSISAGDRSRLESILQRDKEARKVYVRYSSLRSSLRHYASETLSATDEPEANHSQKLIRVTTTQLKWAASIAIAFLLGFIAHHQFSRPPEPAIVAESTEESTYEGMAVLINKHDVVWSDGQPNYKSGDPIPAGHFKIDSGVAQLEFYSGATVVLEGDADLEIIADDKAYCHVGRASVSVSPNAKGFSIETKDAVFIDRGAEFGIAAIPGKPSEIHVFAGEIEVLNTEQSSGDVPLYTLVEGDAAQFESFAMIGETMLAPNQFWTVQMLVNQSMRNDTDRFIDWFRMSDQIAQSDDVVSYFPFYQTTPWMRQLENFALLNPEVDNGGIVGGQWVKGRWPEKAALEFRNASDRVRVSIPGEFDEITFAAWIKVKSLKNQFNGLLMTDSFKTGNPHWQLNQEGQLILGLRSADTKEEFFQALLFSDPIFTPDLYGEWLHVVSSFDTETSRIKHYLNGQLIKDSGPSKPFDTKIVFGSGEIGNWGLPYGQSIHQVRNFDGAIDEMLVVSRVMSDGEISELYERGRPNPNSTSYRVVANKDQ